MSTLKDLYQRVAAALENMPASVKADVDSAFVDHVKANPDTAYADSAPANDGTTDDTAAIRDSGGPS